MTPEVTDFVPGSLEDTDKFIEVVDGHHVTAKQKGSVRIQMCDKSLSVIVAHLYAYWTFLFCRYVMSVRNFNEFICIL